jgi:DNA-binding NarL/FixJ family response regulator
MILETQSDLEVVGDAGDGIAAVDATRRLRPDVVLMDIQMPNLDGLEATKQIVQSRSGSRVLILTTFDLDEYVYRALTHGASGFLLKNSPPEQLIGAVRVIAAGDALLSPSITRRVIEEFSRLPPPGGGKALAGLTDREREVRKLMARGLFQRRDRRRAVRERRHGEKPRGPSPRQAGASRPGPSRGARLRIRSGAARKQVKSALRPRSPTASNRGVATVPRRGRAPSAHLDRGVRVRRRCQARPTGRAASSRPGTADRAAGGGSRAPTTAGAGPAWSCTSNPGDMRTAGSAPAWR